MTTAQTLARDDVSARIALDEPAPNQVEHWAKSWAEHFRRDATAVEEEACILRERLQQALVILEG